MPFLTWRAHVADFSGHERDFEFPIPMNSSAYEELMTEGRTFREVLNFISAFAQGNVLTCGVDWKCICCKEKATNSVNTPAFYKDATPPFVNDYCFLPICEKAECESFGHCVTQDRIDKASREMEKETGQSLLDHRSQFCVNCKIPEQQKELSRCGRCRTVYYCSKECQRAHWQHHKRRCLQVPKEAENKNKKAAGKSEKTDE